jgi:hypothetical protein
LSREIPSFATFSAIFSALRRKNVAKRAGMAS